MKQLRAYVRIESRIFQDYEERILVDLANNLGKEIRNEQLVSLEIQDLNAEDYPYNIPHKAISMDAFVLSKEEIKEAADIMRDLDRLITFKADFEKLQRLFFLITNQHLD